MNTLKSLLLLGENYFGSGSSNSNEFVDFYVEFRRKFTTQLKKLKATEIEFSKGHFYLSGFFKVGEQMYYFSISDVRWGGTDKMLIRTAKHNKDFTGGSNHYVSINSSLYKSIARQFGIKLSETVKTSAKTTEMVVEDIIASGGNYSRRIESTRKADSIAFALKRKLFPDSTKSLTVSNWRRGRIKTHSVADFEGMHYYYDARAKLMSITFKTN